MKRILPLILTVLLLPALLVVPARADESNSYWVNLLDYGYPSGYSTNYIPLSGSQVSILYSNPVGGPLDYVDIILRTDATSFRVASWNSFLTTVDLGGGLFRVFGNLAKGYSYADAEVFFRDHNGTYVEILSFKVTRYQTYNYEKQIAGIVHNYATSPATQTFIAYNGNGEPSNQVVIDPASNTVTLSTFRADLDLYGWQTMDYIHLSMSSFCSSIDSVQVIVDGRVVPYAINYLNINKRAGTGLALIDLTIDVSQLDRIDQSNIVVQVAGTVYIPHQGNFVIQSCYGSVSVDAPSTETFWFTELINSVVSGFSSVSTWISEQTSSLVSWLSQVNISLSIGFDGVSTWLKYVYDSMGIGFTNVSSWISGQTTTIVSYFHNLYGWLGEHTGYITGSIATWGQSLKDSIDALPDKIAEALKDLIVPSDSAIQDFGESSQQIAQDRFGGVYEGAMIVDSFAGQLQAQAATQILTVPVVNLNILGTLFPLGGWEVDLVPEGSEVIIEAVKLMIDILATLAFINGIKSRLERTLEQ